VNAAARQRFYERNFYGLKDQEVRNIDAEYEMGFEVSVVTQVPAVGA
jgi:hypothetical protein